MNIHEIVDVLRETVRQWRAEDVTRMGAALAYYTAFSLVPLFVLSVTMASVIFGAEQVESQVIRSIREVIGQETAQTLRDALTTVRISSEFNPISTLFSTAALILGATGMFRHLKDSLNVIWNVPRPENSKMRGFIRDSVISLLMVMGFGLLLLLVLFSSFVLFAVVRSLDFWFPQLQYIRLFQAFGLVMLVLVAVVIFALIFKILPDAHVTWGDVWAGAALTALLFTTGQFAIALFMSSATFETFYGTASILLIVLVWVYVSAHLVLFGAEFTQVYANRYGSKITPDKPDPVTQIG